LLEIGITLQEARTRQGFELQDAAEATRIRAKYLAALEGERFDQLPAEAYARAFLRTYADFLGLDSELFVAELNSRIAASRPPPPPPPEPRLALPSLDTRAVALLGGAAAVVSVVLAAGHFGGGAQERTHSASSSQVAGVKKTITRPSTTPKPASRPELGRLILVAARGNCWLSVRTGSREGRVLYEGLLREGEVVRVAGARLWVRIGAPWNLEARLNGQPLQGLPADTGSVFITPAGLTPA